MLFSIEQKKGNEAVLDGRLTVYATIDLDSSEISSSKQPIASMIRNGMLSAQGNFRDQYNLRDFLKNEMGLSLEEGLGEFMDRLGGFDGETPFNPEHLKDRMKNIEDFEDMIPTPAKIVEFHSDQDILSQEGDVFYLGTFRNISNATLGINAFPILYQVHYREQEIRKVRSEIDSLVARIERNEPIESGPHAPGVDAEEQILKEFIPNMLYSRDNPKLLKAIGRKFHHFCRDQDVSGDVDAIVGLIEDSRVLTREHFKLLELYAKKIGEVFRGNAAAVKKISVAIDDLQNNLGQ